MGKLLVIAEKPSVGRDIAKVLKCKQKGDGCLVGEKYIVSWAIGHLAALKDPEDYNEALKKWSYKTLPVIPENIELKPIKNTVSQFKILKKLMNSKDVDSLICATDSGREGELIFRYIYSLSNCKKPFKRLWISSMTDKAIKEGFDNLKDGEHYDNLFYSAKCRSEADWLVGINATRAYTIKYNALLSIGRVQTPTLGIIVNRQEEIDRFDIKDYYEVQVDYEDFNGTWFDKDYTDTKIFEKAKADAIMEKIAGETAKVINIEKEEKKQSPPLLYDLTELQRDCNKKFGFTAKKTLSVAQSLYETKKLITYPRTDSRYLSDDMIPKVKGALLKINSIDTYKPYVEGLLKKENLPISKRIIDNSKVTDHHAIIPTDNNIKLETLSQDEKKVFHIIVLRFISVFYPQYIYSTTKIITMSQQEKFISKGMSVISLGWMEVYKKLDTHKPGEDDKKDDQVLPNILKDDERKIINQRVVKKKTTPPKPYTEATLLSAMENAGRFVEEEELKEQLKESGLGTPSTRAAIIERLIQVSYITRKGKSLTPTEKGINLMKIIPKELKSPQITGKWEKGLSSISKGKMEPEKFMGSITKFVYYIISESGKTNGDIVFEEESKTYKPKSNYIGKCPKCSDGAIFENTKAFYCSNWKSGCKFTIWKNSLDMYNAKVDKNMVIKLLKDRKIKDIRIMLPQTGEAREGTLILKNDNSGTLELMELRDVVIKE